MTFFEIPQDVQDPTLEECLQVIGSLIQQLFIANFGANNIANTSGGS